MPATHSFQHLLNAAALLSYHQLEKATYAITGSYSQPLSLQLASSHLSHLTTPSEERLARFQTEPDPALAELYFHYGRYLLISSTRVGGMPANLQGLWANATQAPWNSDYHLNINVQMNYWPAEVCNLSDLHRPLLHFAQELVPSGTRTAQTYYKRSRLGGTLLPNPWHFTAPERARLVGCHQYGRCLADATCVEPLPLYSKIKNAQAYPMLQGAAGVFPRPLIEEPTHGWLVTAPLLLARKWLLPTTGRTRKPVFVCMGPTMDNQIVRELLTHLLQKQPKY